MCIVERNQWPYNSVKICEFSSFVKLTCLCERCLTTLSLLIIIIRPYYIYIIHILSSLMCVIMNLANTSTNNK